MVRKTDRDRSVSGNVPRAVDLLQTSGKLPVEALATLDNFKQKAYPLSARDREHMQTFSTISGTAQSYRGPTWALTTLIWRKDK